MTDTRDWMPLAEALTRGALDWDSAADALRAKMGNTLKQLLNTMAITMRNPVSRAPEPYIRQDWVLACEQVASAWKPSYFTCKHDAADWVGVCMPLKGWRTCQWLFTRISPSDAPTLKTLETCVRERFSCATPSGTVHLLNDSPQEPRCLTVVRDLLASDPSIVTCTECLAAFVERVLE